MNTSTLPPFRIRSLSLLVACASCAALPVRAETDGSIHKTFDAAPGGKLVVDVSGSKVDVQGTGGSQVVVEYTRIVSAGSKADEEKILKDREVTLTQSGDTVSLIERRPQSSQSDSISLWKLITGGVQSMNSQFRVTVKVPAQFNVDLRTSGGSIEVGSLTGQVTTHTSGGSMTFGDITGNINGHTSGGGIHVDRVKGDVDLSTSGGSVTAANGTGKLSVRTSGGGISITGHSGNTDADTSGGSIKLSLTSAPNGENRLSTSGGSITVSLPPDSALNVDASTSGGGVTTNLPVTSTTTKERNRFVGAINGGGPLLHLRTSGGSIRVTSETLAGR